MSIKQMCKFFLCLMTAAVCFGVSAEIQLVSPVEGNIVPLLSGNQKKLKQYDTPEARKAAIEADSKEKKIFFGKKAVWRNQIPVEFKWKCTDGESVPFRITVSEKPDFSDPVYGFICEYQVKYMKYPADKYSMAGYIGNFKIGQKYYWKVTSFFKKGVKGRTKTESVPASFVTEDLTPRWIALMPVHTAPKNIRDLGGYRTLDGKRVKQGMIFRGPELNGGSFDGELPRHSRLTCYDLDLFLNRLKIRSDLDLRSRGEIGTMKVSPLGESVKFFPNGGNAYEVFFSQEGKRKTAANFRVFCDEANYPVYFHCQGGADRTGSLAFILEAVLGFTEKDIALDYERTFYPNQRKYKFFDRFQTLVNGIRKYGKEGDTIRQCAESYLKSAGIKQEEIEKFRSIMLNN